jgi:hypothetical protein
VNVKQAIRELQAIADAGGGNLIIVDDYAESELTRFEKSVYEDGQDISHPCVQYTTAELEEVEEGDPEE